MPETTVPESVLPGRPTQQQAHVTTIRLLQVLVAAALLLPLLLFSFASWLSYRGTQEAANEKIERSLDVMQEEALKAFQSTELAIITIDDLLGNQSEAEIQADEARLHARLMQILGTLPDVQSIWILGPTGHPEVMTRADPAITSLDFSAEDYFRVPRDLPPPGEYIGSIHQSNTGGRPYFTFNRARYGADGKFAGTILLSLLPSDFSDFYSRMASGAGLQFAMIRDDGTELARIPEPITGDVRLSEHSAFRRIIAADPAGGLYTTTSELDHIERRYGVRRVPGFPIYMSAGIATDELRNEWMGGMAMHLIFGIPATAFLCGALIVVLQRTKRLHVEENRRELAEAGMRQAQKMEAIGHLTGGIAHDFNNMLAIVLGSLDIALRRLVKGDTAVEKYLQTAQEGARRAAALTKQLLAFSRQQPLQPQSVACNKLVSEMSELLRRSLGETIKLETVLAGGLWRTNVDGNQLESAILNLAINARDAMPEGGKLTIETANTYLDDRYAAEHAVPAGQYVLIAVTDTGAGMTQDVMERAFDPFFTTKKHGAGTGLGLSQVYGFVRQSGGHIKIYSEVGQGTIVKIYLPRYFGADAPNDVRIDRTPSPRADGNVTVLVVEDDDGMRAYAAEAVQELGYKVLEAANGPAALELLESHPEIDLLFTDVVMPDMNGRRMTEQALRRRPSIKVLFTTGYTRNAIVHNGMLDPDVQLLAKPFTLEDLANKVAEVMKES